MSIWWQRQKVRLQLLAVLLANLTVSGPVWAQRRGQPPEEPVSQEAWVLSYALVILTTGLALFVICRPGRRFKDVKRS
jgi:hypothetical protein